MTAGLCLLRIRPADFWAMTPRELAFAAGWLPLQAGQAPDRAGLEAMIRRFPDH